MSILLNILWIILAYLIGSLNFSIIFTMSKKRKNIKNVGSGNAGATNAMRTYGFKFGFLIFILDASKSFWFGFVLGFLQTNVEAFYSIIPQVCMLFIILGHIFPIYFKFKGGKGAASLLGMIASISLILAAISAILFIFIVVKWKYISLGSIVVPYIASALSFLLPYFNSIDTTITYGPYWISTICLFVGSIMVALSHYENIIKLINKNENKFSISNIQKNENEEISNSTSEELIMKNEEVNKKETSIIDIVTKTSNKDR